MTALRQRNGQRYVGGTLKAANDVCAIPMNLIVGEEWATAVVQIAASAAFTGTLVWEVSFDGGVNYAANAYAKRLDAVTANPSVVASLAGAGAVTAQNYELPLPAGVTHVQVRCSAYTSGSINVTMATGRAYTPGSIVSAVLSDLTEAGTGLGINTAVAPIDVSGWGALTMTLISPTTVPIIVRVVDDAGNLISGSTITMTAPSTLYLTLCRNAGGVVTSQPLGSGSILALALNARRLAVYLLAGGTLTSGRIRIEASR